MNKLSTNDNIGEEKFTSSTKSLRREKGISQL